MGELISESNSKLQATLEALDRRGVHPIDFDLIRSSSSFAERVADVIAFGSFIPTCFQVNVRSQLGPRNVWFPGDWERHFRIFSAFAGEIKGPLLTSVQLQEFSKKKEEYFLFWTPELSINSLRDLANQNLTVSSRRVLFHIDIDDHSELADSSRGWYLVKMVPVVGSEGKLFQDQVTLLGVGEVLPNPAVVCAAYLLYFIKNGVRFREGRDLRVKAQHSDKHILIGWHTNCVGVDMGLQIRECHPNHRDGRTGLAAMVKL